MIRLLLVAACLVPFMGPEWNTARILGVACGGGLILLALRRTPDQNRAGDSR